MTFTWNDEKLDYFDHPYNSTRANERAVEIAVAEHWLRGLDGFLPRRPDGLEVGNVLAHYAIDEPIDRGTRRTVDLHEGPERLDVFDVDGYFDWIVSLSTIEHVHWDDRHDPDAAGLAVEHLLGLLNPCGQMLVTVPLGWHPHLDEQIATGALCPDRDCVFIRDGDGWAQRTRRTWRPYGVSTPWAEAVWIGEWRR